MLNPDLTRARLVSWHRLDRVHPTTGAEGVQSLLTDLRCIQLDPLDPIGTNADLVAHARVDGLSHGDVYRHLLPGHAFEHFAKERCLLPVSRFNHYRNAAVHNPWWRATAPMKKVSEALLAAVLEEVRERGPLLASQLTERGRVTPADWSGWKTTSRAAKVALEVLWRRCQVVVHDRTPQGKRWSVPEVAMPVIPEAEGSFEEVLLKDRIRAMGLIPAASGPWWSMLKEARRSGLPDALVERGEAVPVELPGTRKRWLAHPEFLELTPAEPDDRMRILGPLDPMIWDRDLIRRTFDFEYLWEVYKPAAKRRWGWYVCPLLHRGHLVGRVEARRGETSVDVQRVWREREFDDKAFGTCIERLNRFLYPPTRCD